MNYNTNQFITQDKVGYRVFYFPIKIITCAALNLQSKKLHGVMCMYV